MQEILSWTATLVVLVALSGILPIMSAGPAAAQEGPPIEIARALPAPERHRAESIDIDALTLDSDFTIFMRRDCPPELQLRALRKLWTLLPQNPVDETAF